MRCVRREKEGYLLKTAIGKECKIGDYDPPFVRPRSIFAAEDDLKNRTILGFVSPLSVIRGFKNGSQFKRMQYLSSWCFLRHDICILGIYCDSYLSLVAYLVLYHTAAFRFRTFDETPSFFVVGILIDELSRYYLPTRYLCR